jgi:hypothetical protein
LRHRLRVPLAALFLVAVVCLSACQTTIHVGVDVKANGSGSVTVTATLDQEAAAYASDVRTSDLAKAGWNVAGPTPAADGGVTFTASKAFADPTQAKVVISQLSGPTGPFRNLAIESRRSFFRSETSFKGTVDLTCGLNCFSDPQLQQSLGGADDAGINASALQADAGIIVDRLFQFEVAARLPGPVQSNAPTQVGNGALWTATLGQKAVLVATSRSWNVFHIELAVAGGVVVLAGVVVALVLLVKRRRRRRPAHAHSARKHRAKGGDGGRGPREVPVAAAPDPAPDPA